MATILVVEDDQGIRALVAKVLRADGHEVITVSNGLEGIALFRSSPGEFDLILTDLQMPVMNGHEMVKLVREASGSTKIICMSGFTTEPIPANTEFLQKPFLPGALRVRVSAVLNRL